MRYLSYSEAIVLHIELMRSYGETRFGIAFTGLIHSALARPLQAKNYENASIFRQAATLCFGLIKNHPWIGGNKRTATHLTDTFLQINGWEINASLAEIIELSLAIEADQVNLDEIEVWFQTHTIQSSEFS
jgi:death on curing protein